MASDRDRREDVAALRAAERAAAVPYIEYPALPWWYPAVAGAWFAALIASTTSGVPTGLRVGIPGVLLALGGIAFGWYRTKRGADPSTRPADAPPEIGRLMRRYYAVAAVLVVVVLACRFLAPAWVTIVVTFVGATAGLAIYESAYRRAANAVRARLR